MRPYRLSDRAVSDITQARGWYDRLREGLGDRFVAAVHAAVQTARERPMSCPLVENGIRVIRCERFPYRVYFEVLTSRVEVLAVYHTARKTRHWNDPDRP